MPEFERLEEVWQVLVDRDLLLLEREAPQLKEPVWNDDLEDKQYGRHEDHHVQWSGLSDL